MNKRLLTLSMVGLLSIGLTSCSDVKRMKDSGKEVIVTVGSTKYTADDLLEDYGKTSAGVSAYYDAIYDVLVRNTQEITSTMEDDVDNTIDKFVKSVKSNAASNNKTYRSQLSDELDSQGLDSLAELREVEMLKKQKEVYEEQWYDDHMEDLSKRYFEEKTPYHVKHILVKTNSAGTSLYDGKISESEALKLYSVVDRLSTNQESFGQIAQQASEDEGSAAKYGSLGIMDKDTGFVSPFKLGVYAYDALYQTNDATEQASRSEALSIPEKVMDETSDVDAPLSGLKSLNVKEAIESVGLVPYQAFADLKTYADKTKTIDNLIYVPQTSDSHYKAAYADRVGQTINESYYPRNIIFNNYLNDNGLYVITDEGYAGTDSSRFQEFPNIKAGVKILTDGNGNPILVTRAGSGDSYQGIHFIVIEQSPFYYDSAKLKYTTFNKGTIAEPNIEAPASVEDYLLYYYSTDVPATTTTDVSKDQRLVTFVKSSRTDYQSEATSLESKFKGFDSNVKYKVWEDLVYSDASTKTVKAGLKIDETVLKSIENWISAKYAAAEITKETSNEETWTSYVQLLTLQDEEKDKKQLSLDFIKLYDDAYTVGTVKTNKD